MNFKEFAVEHGLNVWDWVAVTVSSASMLIAIISLLVAFFTLRSQKQTEKNTMPIINTDIQEFLLQEFIFKLIDGQIRIGALWHLLNEKQFKYYPSEHILDQLIVETDTIHTELFYKDTKKYRCLQGLLNTTVVYNKYISVLNSHLSNNNINNDFLYQEFKNILNQNERLAVNWRKVMSYIYGYDITHTTSVFNIILEITENPPADYNFIYFNGEDEKYLEFILDEDKKKKLLYFMDSRAISYVNEYKKYLIKK